jgi:hypothetical protein
MSMSHEWLRHTVATLAYRGGKAVRGAPDGFSGFSVAPGSRSAGEILAHIGDLLDWGVSMARGKQVWQPVTPGDWDADVRRFFDALAALDAAISSDQELGSPPEQIFQGPIADALTHVGQLAMMRRLAGAPVKGENYAVAAIEAGQVGAEQPHARREFD